MEIEKSIDAIRDEVLRKIGRNVVLFQQLECLMKAVVANKNIAAPASTITQVRATKHAEFENHTMGQLVGKLQKDLYVTTDDDADSATPDEISEPWISFSFRIQSDAAFVDSRSKALSELVASRNDLVHKLLPRWQMESADSCKDLENHLDAQAISVRAEISWVHRMGKSNLSWHGSNKVVLSLCSVISQGKRPDQMGGHIFRQQEVSSRENRLKNTTRLKVGTVTKNFWIWLSQPSYSMWQRSRDPTAPCDISIE
jgi:hypothetical protein